MRYNKYNYQHLRKTFTREYYKTKNVPMWVSVKTNRKQKRIKTRYWRHSYIKK